MNFMHWMQRIHHPTARNQCIDEGYRLCTAAISRSESGAFLSFTIVQFIFDCEFKVRLSLDSPGARRIRVPRAFTPDLLWYRRGPKMLGRAVADRCGAHFISAFGALAVADEIGEGPQSTQLSRSRQIAELTPWRWSTRR